MCAVAGFILLIGRSLVSVPTSASRLPMDQDASSRTLHAVVSSYRADASTPFTHPSEKFSFTKAVGEMEGAGTRAMKSLRSV
jgi:hypothetical protein